MIWIPDLCTLNYLDVFYSIPVWLALDIYGIIDRPIVITLTPNSNQAIPGLCYCMVRLSLYMKIDNVIQDCNFYD